jgi:hypothetical protein
MADSPIFSQPSDVGGDEAGIKSKLRRQAAVIIHVGQCVEILSTRSKKRIFHH